MERTSVIVLTGGAATRIRPLSSGRDKCMIPFMGRPLLSHLLESLVDQGFSDLLFTSVGIDAGIKTYYGTRLSDDVHINYCRQSPWLGTAGTVARITEYESVSDPFFVIYGDSLLDVNFRAMLDFHRRNSPSCTVLFHRPRFDQFRYEYHDSAFENRGPRTNYGVMDLTGQQNIVYIEEKPLLERIPIDFKNPVANAAVYIMTKDAVAQTPHDMPADFPRDVFPQVINRGDPILGFDIRDGYRFDVGTLDNYYSLHFKILRRQIRFRCNYNETEPDVWTGVGVTIHSPELVRKPAMLGHNTIVGKGSRICSSIIGNNVSIGIECVIVNSIILDGTVLGNGTQIENSIIDENSRIAEKASLSNSILGSHSLIGSFVRNGTEISA